MAEEKPKTSYGKIALWIGLFLVAVVAIVAAKIAERHNIETALANKAQEIHEKVEQAIKEQPSLMRSEAERQVATKNASAMLAARTGKRQTYEAANLYFGFLMANTRARPDFCREQGVEIPTFTTTFEQIHKAETEKAKVLWAQEKGDMDAAWSALAANLRKGIQQDMEDEAKSGNLNSLKEACQSFELHGAEYANDMNLISVMPDVYKVLMSAP